MENLTDFVFAFGVRELFHGNLKFVTDHLKSETLLKFSQNYLGPTQKIRLSVIKERMNFPFPELLAGCLHLRIIKLLVVYILI